MILRIAFFLIIILSILTAFQYKNYKNETGTIIEINGARLKVEIADSITEISKGLMGRETLEKDRGMLFIFSREGVYPFWMKNTLIPLDIIWVNKEKKVVFINENTPPCEKDPCASYDPQVTASYVIEANSGWVKENQIEVGQEIIIK